MPTKPIVANRALITSLMKGPIKGMFTPGGYPLDPSKLIILIIFDPLWVYGAVGNILLVLCQTLILGNGL